MIVATPRTTTGVKGIYVLPLRHLDLFNPPIGCRGGLRNTHTCYATLSSGISNESLVFSRYTHEFFKSYKWDIPCY